MRKPKYSIEQIKKILEESGCILISNEYKYSEKIEYICKCGNRHQTKLANFLNGQRCRNCGAQKQKENAIQKTINGLKEICKKNQCELIELKNNMIYFVCSCGKNYNKTYKKFKTYPYCKDCGLEIRRKTKLRPDQEQYQKERVIYRYSIGTINYFMKSTTGKTNIRKLNEFGYSPKELQEHIKNHKNYDNVKNNFSIDHIYPLTAFFKKGIYDLSIINHLTNLRPYDQSKNKIKNYKYNEHEFQNWLKEIGYKNESKA